MADETSSRNILIKQKASPKGYPACVLFRLVKRRISVMVHVEVKAKVASHSKAHSTIHPTFCFSTASCFADGHEGKCLH
jgi:hypothetical protein